MNQRWFSEFSTVSNFACTFIRPVDLRRVAEFLRFFLSLNSTSLLMSLASRVILYSLVAGKMFLRQQAQLPLGCPGRTGESHGGK